MKSDQNIAIQVENLNKCYPIYEKPSDRLKQMFWGFRRNFFREFWAVKNTTFYLKKGEILGVIGNNGSGKSTLLQMIAGTLNQTSGTIKVNGRVSAILELGSGFNPEFSGKENVYLNASILGMNEHEINQKYDEIVEFAGIGEFIDQPVKTYSSGMLVRLAFSVAINVNPDILIIDEALAVGDPNFQLKCMQKIEGFRNQGKTIILVSHDLGSILQFSNKCLLMDAGHSEFFHQPKEAVDAFKMQTLGVRNSYTKRNKEVAQRIVDLQAAKWASAYDLNFDGAEIYGNHKAKIRDFGIFNANSLIESQRLLSGETYTFKMRVIFIEDVDSPIFSLTFRDVTGREVVGTNTKNEKVFLARVARNNQIEVSFTHKLRIAPGNYLVTFACSGFDRDEFVVHERLYHIFLVEVYSKKSIVGYYDMEAEVKLKEIGLN